MWLSALPPLPASCALSDQCRAVLHNHAYPRAALARFNVVGAVFQNFIWVAVLLTGLAGGLAAKSYNDGATFFLQKATSDLDSAKVISLEEVQRARNLPPASQAPETE